jgi:hypothetical protein
MDNPPVAPSSADFAAWPSSQVRVLTTGKTVLFAPGGTSRWYFLEHGDASSGYAAEQRFRDYGRRALTCIVELVDMMFTDGVGTIFVVGFVPGQNQRDDAYNQNLSWAYELLLDEQAQQLYAHHNLGVAFRGGWESLFERLGATALHARCNELEQRTCQNNENRRLIWLTTTDEIIPHDLLPIVTENIFYKDKLPAREILSTAYYGKHIQHIDILIANNKPSLTGLLPPLVTTVHDAYFTVSPTLYMDQHAWRAVLYDHLFARQGHFRDYTQMDRSAIEDMRAYYRANQDTIIGLGSRHVTTQTWRPQLPANE